MLLIKTRNDLEKMRMAGEISAAALKLAGDSIKAGVTTGYIDGQVRGYMKERGAEPSFLGYNGFPAAVCISLNDEVIHGIPSKDRLIRDGDIVSVDVGACYEGFHGDNAATFPVGEITPEAAKLVETTRECLFRAVAVSKSPNRIGDIGYTVQSCAEQNGFSVVRAFIGHGVGKKLHEDPEVPNFGRPGRGLRLIRGMTLAVEPMINEGAKYVRVKDNGWTVVTKDGSLSAHFEMTLAITDGEPVVLTDWRKLF